MSRARAFAQLVRLPNVFTALADIALGGLAILADRQRAGLDVPGTWWLSWLCLMAASACLYSAGMVWNDFFDIEQDRRERPFRPLPSGRIRRAEAARLGAALMVLGVALAALAGWLGEPFDMGPGLIAAVLVGTILLYDGWLKRTWLGPLGMGACRFLNVLLGFSVGGAVLPDWAIHAASVVGLYIVGVTWFARTEAGSSRPRDLAAAAGVMLAALALALPLPVWFPEGTTSPLFPYLLVGLGFLVGIPVAEAVPRPKPARVQRAVKRAILGLVVLDAVLATALAGAVGLVILVFLAPALWLGRWIYST
jgi:4-hydroxybenzoate polyprenyltransferase